MKLTTTRFTHSVTSIDWQWDVCGGLEFTLCVKLKGSNKFAPAR
ncbi:MAG: hypothetical protein ACKVHO_22665 [Verrucomicrobiia bacterium]|jgi:hypothetical protein